jgi:Zn-dependent protease with chaperone function
VDSSEQKPIFGQSNPALVKDHEPWGKEILQWIIGLVIGVLVIYWLIGLAANILASRISDKQEASWFEGEKIFDMTGFVTDSGGENPDFARCKELLTKLMATQKLRNLPYDLHYSPSKTPNAFAAPGGSLMVTQGFLDLVKSDMGIAMVLGHELGHHQHRDPLRGMGRSVMLGVVTSIFLGGSSNLVKMAFNMADSSYSRDQELKADEFGFKLLHATFHKTDGAFEFFEKISTGAIGQVDKISSMMSTHPYTPDRIERLKELQVKLNKPGQHN